MSAVGSVGAVVGQGIELAGQVSASAAELMRVRKDPAVVAERRRRAARRRVQSWSAGGVVAGALTATGVATAVTNGASAGVVGALFLVVAVLVWCIVGLVRAVTDLRARTRELRALPPPQPARTAVAGAIRPEMKRLDGYSDALRQLVGMVGVIDDQGVRELRDEILAAADAAEARLREQAAALTGVLRARRAAPPDAAAQLDATAAALRRRIGQGVDGYKELVAAASEAVSASRSLADADPGSHAGLELQASSDRLRGLAAGMRELTAG